MPIVIKQLGHCGLVVGDLDRTRRFYATVLGMEEVPRPATFSFKGAWFRRGACEVHVIVAEDTTAPPGLPDAGPGKRTGLATHVAFEVDDVDAATAHLTQHGVEIVGGPVARGDGVRQIWFHDPDGYLLECFQYVGPDEYAPERGAVRRR